MVVFGHVWFQLLDSEEKADITPIQKDCCFNNSQKHYKV